nr:MAG TPA: Fe-S oxidoreductase [Bacteriophage sp.]
MPIFRLEFADGSSGFFESESTTFLTGDGRVIEIEPFVKAPVERDNMKSYALDGLVKSDAPRFVRLVFGFNCNMHCKYCSQANTDKRAGASVKQAVDFVKRFCATVKGEPKRMELWGGEPLVYWKHIKAVMPILKERFPHTLFGIITNGTLVTPEIVDFLDKNEITCVISYDGPGQSIRGEDVFADERKRRLWQDLYHRVKDKPLGNGTTLRFAISSTLTHQNYDVSEVVKYVRNAFDEPSVPVMHDYVTAMGGILGQENYDSTAFCADDYVGIESSAYKNLCGPESEMSDQIGSDARKFLAKAIHHTPTGTSICGSDGDDCLFVKIDGSVLKCQNEDSAPGQYGSVFDLEHARIPGATPWQKRESCASCPFSGLCRGACPFMKGNALAQSCAVKRGYYKAIFRWVVEQTYSKQLVAIHGDLKFPAIELIETPHGKIDRVQTVRFFG